MQSSCIRHPSTTTGKRKLFIKICDWQLACCSKQLDGESIGDRALMQRAYRCSALLSMFEYAHNWLLSPRASEWVTKNGMRIYLSYRQMEEETLGIAKRSTMSDDLEYLQSRGAITIHYEDSRGDKLGYEFCPEDIQNFIDNKCPSSDASSSNCCPNSDRGVRIRTKTAHNCPNSDIIYNKNKEEDKQEICVSPQQNAASSYPKEWQGGVLKDDVARSLECAFLEADIDSYLAFGIPRARKCLQRIAAVCRNSSADPIHKAGILFMGFLHLRKKDDFWRKQPFTPHTMAGGTCLAACNGQYSGIKKELEKYTLQAKLAGRENPQAWAEQKLRKEYEEAI